jgi:hypothetical protein
LIRQGLEVIKKEIQTFLDLKDAEGIREVVVVASNILNEEGKLQFKESNNDGTSHHVVISLVNIEEEKHLKSPPKTNEISAHVLAKQNPEIHINLYALFTAFSSHYETSLGIISDVIGFFQSKPLFNRSNTPSLDTKIEKIIADLCSLSFEQQNHLWSSMGAKYMPSVLYKLRMLIIDEELIKDKAKPVTEIKFTE